VANNSPGGEKVCLLSRLLNVSGNFRPKRKGRAASACKSEIVWPDWIFYTSNNKTEEGEGPGGGRIVSVFGVGSDQTLHPLLNWGKGSYPKKKEKRKGFNEKGEA